MGELKITKIDAARRQLETAIRLYFHEGDPASIHTLAAAANQLLRDLNTKRGGAPMFKDWLRDYIKPEFHAEIVGKLNAAENFLKHADHDPDAVLDFHSNESELLMLDCCDKYREITGERLPMFRLFQVWSWLTWARPYIHDEAFDRAAAPIAARLGNDPQKPTFLAQWIEIAYAEGLGSMNGAV